MNPPSISLSAAVCRRTLPAAACFALLAAFAGHAPCQEKTHRIFVLAWRSTETDAVIREGLRAGLVRSREALLIEETDCGSDPRIARAALAEWERLEPSLIFVVGAEGASWLLERGSKAPVLAVCSGAGTARAVSGAMSRSKAEAAAVILEPDPAEILEVFRRFIPGLARLGALHTRTCASAAFEIEAARNALADEKHPGLASMEIVARSVDPEEGMRGVEASFKSLVEAGAQAVWLPDDQYLVTRIEALGEFANLARMPLVASHPHGARRQTVAAISPNYRGLGVQAAAAGLSAIRNGLPPKAARVEITRSFHVVVNLRAAERAGVRIPLDELARADVILDKDGW